MTLSDLEWLSKIFSDMKLSFLLSYFIMKTIGRRREFLTSQLTYLVQILSLGKLSWLKYHEFSLKLLIFSMLQYWDINCKTVTILFCLLIIQRMVYNRAITRFIADNKVVYQLLRREMWLASDNSWALRCLSHLSFRSWWIILCTLEQRMAVSREIWQPDRCLLACPPHWAQGPRCYVPNTVYRCLVAGQLYPSFRFSSADCRCFKVSDPCWAVHSAAFVHRTALTDRDF